MKFVDELKQRNVIRVAIAYAIVAWVLLQAVGFILDIILAPEWVLQVFVLAAVIGLPIEMIFSWVFEITPEGIKLESAIDHNLPLAHGTGRKLDRTIIIFLVLAVVLLLVDRNRGTGELAFDLGEQGVGLVAAGDSIGCGGVGEDDPQRADRVALAVVQRHLVLEPVLRLVEFELFDPGADHFEIIVVGALSDPPDGRGTDHILGIGTPRRGDV